ncbi:hypothetical protein [Aliikangiella sp. IMCC44359]|uniref:hypothetical protein n=1 Tax=Aliikangiella sp. IMCC44359 TaxID=3459125 RepID=UPI00403AD386
MKTNTTINSKHTNIKAKNAECHHINGTYQDTLNSREEILEQIGRALNLKYTCLCK